MASRASTQRPRSAVVDGPSRANDTPSASSVVSTRLDEPASDAVESRMNRIAGRAHEIYERRKGRHGTALEDWLTAERQIDDEIDCAREMSSNADDSK